METPHTHTQRDMLRLAVYALDQVEGEQIYRVRRQFRLLLFPALQQLRHALLTFLDHLRQRSVFSNFPLEALVQTPHCPIGPTKRKRVMKVFTFLAEKQSLVMGILCCEGHDFRGHTTPTVSSTCVLHRHLP